MRKLARIAIHQDGSASALSSTPDLPALEALIGATGICERQRASDVHATDGGYVAVVRAWVEGAPVILPAHATREAAIAEEVAYLTPRLVERR